MLSLKLIMHAALARVRALALTTAEERGDGRHVVRAGKTAGTRARCRMPTVESCVPGTLAALPMVLR